MNIHESTKYIDLELEGKIFLLQKDKDGNLLDRKQMDGDAILKVFLAILEDASAASFLDDLE